MQRFATICNEKWTILYKRRISITYKRHIALGLKTLINSIIECEVGRLVITHKDRLLRFGSELIFAICEAKEVEVVIINKGEGSDL